MRHADLIFVPLVSEPRGRSKPRWRLMVRKADAGHALKGCAQQPEARELAADLEGAQQAGGVSEFAQQAGPHAEIEPLTGDTAGAGHVRAPRAMRVRCCAGISRPFEIMAAASLEVARQSKQPRASFKWNSPITRTASAISAMRH